MPFTTSEIAAMHDDELNLRIAGHPAFGLVSGAAVVIDGRAEPWFWKIKPFLPWWKVIIHETLGEQPWPWPPAVCGSAAAAEHFRAALNLETVADEPPRATAERVLARLCALEDAS